MARVSLQMIFLGSLLIFKDQTSSAAAAAAGSSRCISEDELNSRAGKFQRSYWDKLSVPQNPVPEGDPRTCAQTLAEMPGGPKSQINHRALSPWSYSINRDVDRVPQDITFARCLCYGCIVDQREDQSYNSVPVSVSLMVLRKSWCVHDPKKYVVKKEFIKVPVACTCAMPKYGK